MRRFLKTELDQYLAGRGQERLEELPLYRVENQQYIHYKKGSLVFYRLREETGEAALNRALKKFLQDKGDQQPPYTTSAELLDYLRAKAAQAQRAAAGKLDDWIKVGVFVRGPSGKEADEKVLCLQCHHITAAHPKLTVVVDAQPYEAGFDPCNKLIDRVSTDSRKRVSL